MRRSPLSKQRRARPRRRTGSFPPPLLLHQPAEHPSTGSLIDNLETSVTELKEEVSALQNELEEQKEATKEKNGFVLHLFLFFPY